MRREPLEQVVNISVNQTLSRTIITAGTTFLSVLALYLFGGEVLRGFAFTMLVGIVSGTYSTVFIASAIAIILSQRKRASRRGRGAGGDAAPGRKPGARARRSAQRQRSGPKRARLPRRRCQLPLVTYLVAALLGVIQGLTEFLPVSSTAHLLIGERAARLRRSRRRVHRDDPARLDPRGDVAVSRQDRRRSSPGCRRDPDARRFALMLVVGVHARRSWPARCSADFVQTRALREPRRHRRGVHRRRHRHAARRAVRARRRRASTPIGRRSARAFGIGVVPDAGARFPACRARARRSSAGMLLRLDRRGGGGVLVLPGDADDGRRRSPTSCSRCATSSAPERAVGDRHRLRDGVPRRRWSW